MLLSNTLLVFFGFEYFCAEIVFCYFLLILDNLPLLKTFSTYKRYEVDLSFVIDTFEVTGRMHLKLYRNLEMILICWQSLSVNLR